MYEDSFITAYRSSRNGANYFVKHPLVRNFLYSDGVQECANSGCYWLLDIFATELPQLFERHESVFCVVKVTVTDHAMRAVGEFHDGEQFPWIKKLSYADLPDGEWVFYIAQEGDRFMCILPSEY